MYITVHLTIGQMKFFVLWNRPYDNVPRIIIIIVIWCPKVLQLFLKLRVYKKIYIYICWSYIYTDQELIDIYTQSSSIDCAMCAGGMCSTEL